MKILRSERAFLCDSYNRREVCNMEGFARFASVFCASLHAVLNIY